MYDVDVEDEVARLAVEHGTGMMALAAPVTKSYYPPVDTEPEMTLTDLGDDELDLAMAELAGQRGISLTEVSEQVDVLAGGERDTQSRAVALLELAAMDSDAALSLSVSAEKRDALADKGRGYALPDGSFPVDDAKHVGVAKIFFKQGKLAGHPAHVVRSHISKAAARLGVPGLDDEDGDDDTEDSADREVARRKPKGKPKGKPAHPATSGHATKPVQVARRGQYPSGTGGEPGGGEGPSGGGAYGGSADVSATARRMAVRVGNTYQTVALTHDQLGELGLAGGDALSPVDRIARRNPEYFALAATPLAFDGPGVGPNVGQHFDFEVHEITDEDPTDDRSAKEIARVLKEHGGTGLFGGGGAAYGANVTHRRSA